MITHGKMENAERFLKYISKDSSCWNWTSTVKRDGYGQFWFQGKPSKAHHVSHILFKGTVPDGLCVLHTCDNKRCVNPDHLYAGTHKDNSRDRLVRGRFRGHQTLSKHDIPVIKSMLAKGYAQASIAKIYGVQQQAISKVKNGMTWANEYIHAEQVQGVRL